MCYNSIASLAPANPINPHAQTFRRNSHHCPCRLPGKNNLNFYLNEKIQVREYPMWVAAIKLHSSNQRGELKYVQWKYYNITENIIPAGSGILVH